jgi:hypothetical protein
LRGCLLLVDLVADDRPADSADCPSDNRAADGVAVGLVSDNRAETGSRASAD